MHTNTGRQTRQKLREPLQRAQRLYFFILYFQTENAESHTGSHARVHLRFAFQTFEGMEGS